MFLKIQEQLFLGSTSQWLLLQNETKTSCIKYTFFWLLICFLFIYLFIYFPFRHKNTMSFYKMWEKNLIIA